MNTLNGVIKVVGEVFETPTSELTPGLRFIEDLGATSLDVVTLVWRIEEVFGLGEIEESALQAVETIADLAELVEARQGEPSEVVERVDVAIASDHAGLNLKAALVDWLRARGKVVVDLGPGSTQSVDYPDFAARVSRSVTEGTALQGVLVCGSGIGMSIAANKVPGVRAVVVANPLQAKLSRQHNDAKILCLGERLTGVDMATECLQAFLSTPFDPGDDGRHQRRVRKISDLHSPSESSEP